MSRSSEGSNIAKDDADQHSRNEGEGHKKGDSEQEQMSKQDQNRQQLPGGNNSRQSSQNSHQPQLGNTQPGNPFSQGHPPSPSPQLLQSETDKPTSQGHGDGSLAGKQQPSKKVSGQEQLHTNEIIPSRDHERVAAEPERRAQTQNSRENKEKATKIVLHERPNPDNGSSCCCSCPSCSIL